MHFTRYYDAFIDLVGPDNVGWFIKNHDDLIVDCDPEFKFAEIANIAPNDFVGRSTACLPWGHLRKQIDAADVLVKLGEVRETVVTYWHPGDVMYRRLLGAKFQPGEGDDNIVCLAADITAASLTSRMAFLELEIGVDWEKEKITVFGKSINRVDLVVLAHYLNNLTYEQIAVKVHRSKKSIDKRLCKVRDILCGLDPDTSTLFEVCKKYDLDKIFAEKIDWFDRLPVVTTTKHLQFKL